MLPYQPNQSVLDAIRCLQALAASTEPCGVRELARQTGIDLTKVNRLLLTMAHTGMVQRTARGKYSAGPALYVMSAQNLFISGFFKHALHGLASLRDLGLTVAMGTLWRDKVSYIYHARPGQPVEEALGRFGLVSATGSSIGMSLLAAVPESGARQFFASEPVPGYERRGMEGLLRDLAVIRKRNYAVVKSLHAPGIVSVGVVVKGAPNWAVALSGKIESKSVPKLVKRLHAATGEILPVV